MTPYTVYDQAGRILRTGMCQPDCVDLQAGSGQAALPLASNDETDYVLNAAVVPRPGMDLLVSTNTVPADGTTEVTLTSVPAGAQVSIVGPANSAGQADGGPITLTFAIPGDYVINASLFPYQDQKVTIHAT